VLSMDMLKQDLAIASWYNLHTEHSMNGSDDCFSHM
jgi:hypothetical protein